MSICGIVPRFQYLMQPFFVQIEANGFARSQINCPPDQRKARAADGDFVAADGDAAVDGEDAVFFVEEEQRAIKRHGGIKQDRAVFAVLQIGEDDGARNPEVSVDPKDQAEQQRFPGEGMNLPRNSQTGNHPRKTKEIEIAIASVWVPENGEDNE